MDFAPIPPLVALAAAIDLVAVATGGAYSEHAVIGHRVTRERLDHVRLELLVRGPVGHTDRDAPIIGTVVETVEYDRVRAVARFVDVAAEAEAAEVVPF